MGRTNDEHIMIIPDSRTQTHLKTSHPLPYAPIEALPPELLTEIFSCCALDDALAPLSLRRVSSLWREVVNSSPRVWQCISLDNEARSVDCLRTQANLWIERSIPFVFDVTLHIEVPDLILPLLSPLLPSIERWRSLTITGKREESLELLSSSITKETMHSLFITVQNEETSANLKTTFTWEWPHNYVMNVWLSELPGSHLLASLHFTNVTILEDPPSEIHTQPSSVLGFLTACPALEAFYFSGQQYDDEPPPNPLPIVSLPYLHTLRLKGTCLARTFLSSLHTPRLTNLYLAHLNVEHALRGEYHDEGDSEDEAHDYSQSPWSDQATGMGLRKLIARSNPPIRLLDMDFSDMRTKDFRYVFDRLSLLEDFVIIASDMSDQVVNFLRPFERPELDSTIHLRAPRLRRLELHNCQQLTGDAIVGALTARVNHTDACLSGETLLEVAIATCEGFTHAHGQILARHLGPRLRLI